MSTKEQLIKLVVDGGIITEPLKGERFIFLLNKLEIESKLEAIENYEKKVGVRRCVDWRKLFGH